MFKHSSKFFAAIVVATGLSAVAVADEVARPGIEVAFAAAARPFETNERARAVAVQEDTERSCRTVRRLGGKVKIARHSQECRK